MRACVYPCACKRVSLRVSACILIRACACPYAIRPYRFVLLNSGKSRVFQLTLDNPATPGLSLMDSTVFWVVGTDGGLRQVGRGDGGLRQVGRDLTAACTAACTTAACTEACTAPCTAPYTAPAPAQCTAPDSAPCFTLQDVLMHSVRCLPLHPAPCALRPAHCSLHLVPCALHPAP